MKIALALLITLTYMLAEAQPSQNPEFIKSLKSICNIKASMAKDADCNQIAKTVAQRLATKDCMDDSYLYDTCKEECDTVVQSKKAKNNPKK